MIPEAAMHVEEGKFHVFLQGNFLSTPGANLRRRFSLAHEIGHILFYDVVNGEISPRKDSPRGEKLEAACHKAAAMILVPGKIIQRELKKRPLTSSASVLELASRFEVSAEVMLRRLYELRLFEQDWVPILTRWQGRQLIIEFAPYPPWLRSRLTPPSRGLHFEDWFRGSELPDGTFVRDTEGGTLEASPTRMSGSSVILDLRLRL